MDLGYLDDPNLICSLKTLSSSIVRFWLTGESYEFDGSGWEIGGYSSVHNRDFTSFDLYSDKDKFCNVFDSPSFHNLGSYSPD